MNWILRWEWIFQLDSTTLLWFNLSVGYFCSSSIRTPNILFEQTLKMKNQLKIQIRKYVFQLPMSMREYFSQRKSKPICFFLFLLTLCAKNVQTYGEVYEKKKKESVKLSRHLFLVGKRNANVQFFFSFFLQTCWIFFISYVSSIFQFILIQRLTVYKVASDCFYLFLTLTNIVETFFLFFIAQKKWHKYTQLSWNILRYHTCTIRNELVFFCTLFCRYIRGTVALIEVFYERNAFNFSILWNVR